MLTSEWFLDISNKEDNDFQLFCISSLSNRIYLCNNRDSTVSKSLNIREYKSERIRIGKGYRDRKISRSLCEILLNNLSINWNHKMGNMKWKKVAQSSDIYLPDRVGGIYPTWTDIHHTRIMKPVGHVSRFKPDLNWFYRTGFGSGNLVWIICPGLSLYM